LIAGLLWAIVRYVDFDKFSDFSFWVKLLVSLLALTLIWGWGKKPKRSGDWWKLKASIEEIWRSTHPLSKGLEAGTLTVEQRNKWLQDTKDRLDSQIDNSALLADDEGLGYWRKAQESIKAGIFNEDAEASGNSVYLNGDGTPNKNPPNGNQMFRMFYDNAVRYLNLAYSTIVVSSDEPGGGKAKNLRSP
jgi:hypothetical protein